MRKKQWWVTLFLLLPFSCDGQCPPPNTLPDASDGAAHLDADTLPDASDEVDSEADVITLYDAACSNLKHLGCSEGDVTHCPNILEKIVVSKFTRMDVICIIHAKSKIEVRTCGSVRCF